MKISLKQISSGSHRGEVWSAEVEPRRRGQRPLYSIDLQTAIAVVNSIRTTGSEEGLWSPSGVSPLHSALSQGIVATDTLLELKLQ